MRAARGRSPDNARGVPLIGAPRSGTACNGFHGEGIKIAVIDTGIDYTHANFGGPGTVAAYNAANAADTLPADAALFGPAAPRVKGGIDLVGDDYNADPTTPAYQPVPHPDPNPLDCNGHGSHVAGTAAGSGVIANGATYTGPYNATTISATPGRSARASRRRPTSTASASSAARARPTSPSTRSSGRSTTTWTSSTCRSARRSAPPTTRPPSPRRTPPRPASIVVTSAGNSGPNPYITGSPGTADGRDLGRGQRLDAGVPGRHITLVGRPRRSRRSNANGVPFSGPITGQIAVITTTRRHGAASRSAATRPSTRTRRRGQDRRREPRHLRPRRARDLRPAGRRRRGGDDQQRRRLCRRSRARSPSNPDTGEPFDVTIPFLGVEASRRRRRPTAASSARRTGNGDGVAERAREPGFTRFASFSSGGPRTGDSWLKPDVTAPGVSIFSTGVRHRQRSATISGTSMASPHVAGVAALVRQAHPYVEAGRGLQGRDRQHRRPVAGVLGYRTSRGGTGLVQPVKSTKTQVIASSGRAWRASLNFGFSGAEGRLHEDEVDEGRQQRLLACDVQHLRAKPAGSPHCVASASRRSRSAACKDSDGRRDAERPGRDAGLMPAFPRGCRADHAHAARAAQHGVALRVPYYLVPRARRPSTKLGLK